MAAAALYVRRITAPLSNDSAFSRPGDGTFLARVCSREISPAVWRCRTPKTRHAGPRARAGRFACDAGESAETAQRRSQGTAFDPPERPVSNLFRLDAARPH